MSRNRTLYLSELLTRYIPKENEWYNIVITVDGNTCCLSYYNRDQAIKELHNHNFWNSQVKQWRIGNISIVITLTE